MRLVDGVTWSGRQREARAQGMEIEGGGGGGGAVRAKKGEGERRKETKRRDAGWEWGDKGTGTEREREREERDGHGQGRRAAGRASGKTRITAQGTGPSTYRDEISCVRSLCCDEVEVVVVVPAGGSRGPFARCRRRHHRRGLEANHRRRALGEAAAAEGRSTSRFRLGRGRTVARAKM